MPILLQPKEAAEQYLMPEADSWCVLKQSSRTHLHEGLNVLELAVVCLHWLYRLLSVDHEQVTTGRAAGCRTWIGVNFGCPLTNNAIVAECRLSG